MVLRALPFVLCAAVLASASDAAVYRFTYQGPDRFQFFSPDGSEDQRFSIEQVAFMQAEQAIYDQGLGFNDAEDAFGALGDFPTFEDTLFFEPGLDGYLLIDETRVSGGTLANATLQFSYNGDSNNPGCGFSGGKNTCLTDAGLIDHYLPAFQGGEYNLLTLTFDANRNITDWFAFTDFDGNYISSSSTDGDFESYGAAHLGFTQAGSLTNGIGAWTTQFLHAPLPGGMVLLGSMLGIGGVAARLRQRAS